MIISITIKVPVRPIPAEQCTTVGPGFGSNPSVVSKKEKYILLNFLPILVRISKDGAGTIK